MNKTNPDKKFIGYWRGPSVDDYDLPDPRNLVNNNQDPVIKEKIINYLESGTVKDYYMGFSLCRFCNCVNGCADMTDGIYVWPEGLLHYVKDHNVELPEEFVDYVLEANG